MPQDSRPQEVHETAGKASKRLIKAIEAIPYDDLKAAILRNYGLEDGDQAVLRWETDSAIESLYLMAEIGDQTALEHLAFLGSYIAELLARLVPAAGLAHSPQGHDANQAVSQPQPSAWPYDSGSDQPSLERDLELLDHLPLEKRQQILNILEKNNPGESALIYADDLVRYSEKLLDCSLARDEDLPRSTFDWIDSLVQKVAAIRINRERESVVRSVLGQSGGWPIKISALADGRSEQTEKYIRSLNLGADLNLKVDPGNSRGCKRELGPNTRTGFTLVIFQHLDRERTRERDPYCFQLRKPSPEISNDSDAKLADHSPAIPSKYDPPEVSKVSWINKAVNLPELTTSPDSLQQWHDAAMAYCEHRCGGKFAEYQWPDCISNQAQRRTNEPTPESVKNIISGEINLGLRSLANDSPSR